MWSKLMRAIALLDLEERILNVGVLVTIIGVFLPWLSGEWLGGDRITNSGLSFYTSFLGWGILLMNLFLLALFLSPLVGGSVILRKRTREPVRLFLTIQSTVLILAALSVLTKVTFEFSRMEVRFGIYITLVGSLISVLYAFMLFQQQRKSGPQEVFQHPEDRLPPVVERREPGVHTPPPPPPPPPLEPEDHHLRP